ncbi:hypothetical protein DPMN_154997, partial [Dreissena polymorpha]
QCTDSNAGAQGQCTDSNAGAQGQCTDSNAGAQGQCTDSNAGAQGQCTDSNAGAQGQCTDSNAVGDKVSQGSNEYKRRCCTRISSVVNVTLLIVLCVQKTLASTDRHSEITQRDSTGDIKYCIDVKGSPCKGFDCRQCKLTINATVGALQRSEGPDCSRTKGHKGYRNCADNPSWDCIGQCMDCYGNGTCLDYNSMTQHLGNQSPCTTEAEKIMCCTLLHMLPDDHCRNGGKLFCEGDTYATNCTCPVGWTGETCETRMNETVTCKCFKTDIPWTSFCGENDMYNCTDDGRPENWTECRQTIEGVTFSRCACEKSE